MQPTNRRATSLAPLALLASVTRGAVVAAAVCAAGAACTAAQEPQRGEMNAMCTAVAEENPRIVGLDECGHGVNGLGRAISLDPTFDSTKPVTADELDSTIESIWVHAPFEPNEIRLTGRDAKTGRVPARPARPGPRTRRRVGAWAVR